MKETPTKRSRRRFIEHWQLITLLMMMVDFALIHAAYFLALWIRFDFVFSSIPKVYLEAYRAFITYYASGCLIVFLLVRLYRSIWRYASYVELLFTLGASIFTSVIHAILITLLILQIKDMIYMT